MAVLKMARQNENVKILVMKLLGCLLFFIACAGCSSLSGRSRAELTCQGTDWYEIGRQKGRSGLTQVDTTSVKQACSQSEDYKAYRAILESGYRAGLFDYCSPQNGFRLGRLNLKETGACSNGEWPQFQTSYEQGQRYRFIDGERRSLDLKIGLLTQDLTDVDLSLAKRALLEGQKLELLEQREILSRDLATSEEDSSRFQ